METKRLLFILLLLSAFTGACRNKDLADECPCGNEAFRVKVAVNWEDAALGRAMRMNLFSKTPGVEDYGRDAIPASGERSITLVENASYLPLCYDYYASGIYFRDETTLESFEAYCPAASRATYNTLAVPVEGEATVSDPGGDFYAHAWQETFDVVFCGECEDNLLIMDFYPVNKLRKFTYRVNNIQGAQHLQQARGAISGMAASYFFHTDEPASERSTILFENAVIGTGHDGAGYVEGSFRTFGPIDPYRNRFTIELLSGNNYYTAYWDVSGQIGESMADREAKLARDGYDILISNTTIPEIPDPGGGGSGSGSGFEIGVGEWDNVEIFL